MTKCAKYDMDCPGQATCNCDGVFAGKVLRMHPKTARALMTADATEQALPRKPDLGALLAISPFIGAMRQECPTKCRLKIVPRSTPSADGEWIEVDAPTIVDRMSWLDLVMALEDHVPHTHHVVKIERVR